MKKTLYIPLIVCMFAFTAFGQTLAKPTLKPVAPTAAQQKTIQDGVALHDAKRYDEAIAKYQSVIAENPDCTGAIYELSMTLYAKGDKDKAMEMANRGSKYISDELPLFYVTMANVLDDYGKPLEAVNIYLEGLKLLEGDARFGTYRGSLYYNLGVTYVKQKKYSDARQALKSAVENDYNYASPHYLLAAVCNGTHYRIPALLAASRFVSIEVNTNRTGNAAAIIDDVLKPAPKDPKTGAITITLGTNDPTDEGDFDAVNFLLPTLMTLKDDKDKNKSENERFVDALNSVIALLAEDKKLQSTFVGKNYIPFMVEMKKNDYVDTFGYMVRYIAGHTDAMDWLKAHDEKLGNFFAWAKAYKLPGK